jgi:hypothetical protein
MDPKLERQLKKSEKRRQQRMKRDPAFRRLRELGLV